MGTRSYSLEPVVPAAALPKVAATDKAPQGRVQLELDEQLGAIRYEIELQEQKKKSQALFLKSENPVFDVQVNAGKYFLRARVFDSRGIAGPWSSAESVTVTPAVRQTLEAPTISINETTHPLRIQWKKISDYSVEGKIEYQEYFSDKWVLISKVDKFDSDHWDLAAGLPAGQYRWTMKFVDEVYGESKPVEFKFVTKPSADELRQALRNLEKKNSSGI